MALDDSIKAFLQTEAKRTADYGNLATLEAAVAQAQAPVPPAQAQVAQDDVAFNAALDQIISDATSAKVPPPIPQAGN